MSSTPETTPAPASEASTTDKAEAKKPRSERHKRILRYALPLGAVAIGLGFNDLAIQGMDAYNTGKDVIGTDVALGGLGFAGGVVARTFKTAFGKTTRS